MQRSNRRQVRPITGHPLFPAVVALWFGALFGMGSLAIRSTLIEDLVISARIDLLIPAAAPPLGLTARILIALALGAFGAVLGGWLGRKLGEARSLDRQCHRDAAAMEPSTPATPIDDDHDLTVRRRMLARKAQEPCFEIDELAPLPGGPPQIFAVAETAIAPIDAPEHPTVPAGPLELAGCSAPVTSDPDRVLQSPVAPVEPAARMTLSPEVPQAPPPSVSPEFVRLPAMAAARPAPPAPAPIDPDAPLTDLARRLAEAMQRRRSARAGLPADPRLADSMPDAFRLSLPIEAAPEGGDLILPSLLAPRQLTVPPPASNAATSDRPDEDEEDSHVPDDDRFSSLLTVAPRIEHPGNPFTRIAQPPAPAGAAEPVVIFPGQIAENRPAVPPVTETPAVAANATPHQAHDETERALKLALAGLQQMSGTA